ncbi:MAG: ATP synthase F0 subunit B [Eubacterium sp.]|nr:ATP synthase F0 subunit B [Eubacterium sp.]
MPLNIDFQQIFLHLLNFAILFTGLYIILYKPVKDFIEKRQEHYKEMEEKAKAEKADADKLLKDYEAKLSSVDEEINEKKKKADAEIETVRRDRMEKVDAEADKIIKEAKEKAKRESNRILRDADKEAKQIVAEAADKLVKGSLDEEYEAFLLEAERGR